MKERLRRIKIWCKYIPLWIAVLYGRFFLCHKSMDVPAKRYYETGDEKYNLPKFVALAVPHTSNWDIFGLLPVYYNNYYREISNHKPLRVVMYFKDQWLRVPVAGYLLKKLFFAIGVDRSTKAGNLKLLKDTIAAFKDNEAAGLVIAPEGTRSPVKKWQPGWHMIVKKSEVPVCAFVPNYRDKIFEMGEIMHLTGNYEEDYKKAINDPVLDASKAKTPENYIIEKTK